MTIENSNTVRPENQKRIDAANKAVATRKGREEALKQAAITVEVAKSLMNDLDTSLKANEKLTKLLDELRVSSKREITIIRKKSKIKLTGIVHECLPEVLMLCEAREEVFMPGPTGCGKTHLAKQVAEHLGLRFKFISCTAGMSEGQITGRLLPIGDGGKFEYVQSDFVDCYENGGVFLLDEMDAGDANVLLVINSALANGEMALPNRPANPIAKRHKDFVCIAAANTFGNGADRKFVGRNQLDGSTMDRFQVGIVDLEYDERVEAQLCPDTELRLRLTGYRKAIAAHRIDKSMSTRFMMKAWKMKHEWGQTDEWIDAKFFKGWRVDQVSKVKGGAA